MQEPDVDDLVREFTYRVQPTPCHDELMKELTAYYKENEKFMKKWNCSAGQRARKHLMNIWHLVRERRYEIADLIYRDGEQLDRSRPDKRKGNASS